MSIYLIIVKMNNISPQGIRTYNEVLGLLSELTIMVFQGSLDIAPVDKVSRVETVVVLVEEDIPWLVSLKLQS
jgi:hypothetical protein